MKSWIFALLLGIIGLVLIIFSLKLIRLPLSSTEVDYVNKKLSSIFGIPFVLTKGEKDVWGNVIFREVSYTPEFFGSDFVAKYSDVLSFLSLETNSITFSLHSNSINFQELAEVISSLGIGKEKLFDIATNIVKHFIDRLSSNSFSNLAENGKIRNKDIFYHHSDKLLSAWIDVSVKMSHLEIELSRSVDNIKKLMESNVDNFRKDVYSDYLYNAEKGNVHITSDVFVKLLDGEIATVKSNLVTYQKKVDDIYLKLSFLREGYKLGWDEKSNMLKRNPQKYLERYVSNFPYYIIRKIMNYEFVKVPKILVLRDPKYLVKVENNTVHVSVKGEIWDGGRISFNGSFSNRVWSGKMELSGIKNTLGIGKVVVNFSANLFMDTLGGEYKSTVEPDKEELNEIVVSFLTNSRVIDGIIRDLTTEEGFVSALVEDEIEALFRSYKEQYERYRAGILKDIEKVYREFLKEIEKRKRGLRKSYLVLEG